MDMFLWCVCVWCVCVCVYVCVCVVCVCVCVCMCVCVWCVCAHVHVHRWYVCMYMHAACVCAHVYVHKASYCVITKLNRSNILVGCGLRRDSPTLSHQLVDGLGAARRLCRVLPCRYHCNCLHERDIFM